MCVYFLYIFTYRTYKTYSNILSILSAFEKSLSKVNRENNDFIKIYITENSPELERNLLIFLNTIQIRTRSLGNSINEINVFISKNVRLVELSKINLCFCLLPDRVNILYNFSDSLESGGLVTFVKDTHVKIQSFDYFDSCNQNILNAPLVTKIWARNILKGYKPGSFIISVHFPEYDGRDSSNTINNWKMFFSKSQEDFPHIHFVLLNYSTDWNDGGIQAMHNVTVTKILGYNFLEEFALVQTSDMFIGSYDKYAPAIIGTNKPFILLGLSDYDKENSFNKLISDAEGLIRNNNQMWIFDTPHPMEFYTKFKSFITTTCFNIGEVK